ncbi:trehalose-phosphatase [Microbacterium foliorum]|uniref:Trehalose 6-phosphate phosphatase n=1 Tax=Microbacterium foliorum TaxID=104336 RepID=A0A0F0KBV9_9MICO|nr:trehalose-phosphatase [Microbacterium foliorum]AXL11952.1 trehalose-phosphatase [Microbacterium foliorum]KJL17894.1 Trehalose-6-phosphate phosphatase [Microbacterium foliorum]CAH0126156.1 Trehalose-6-phosphate phosphatase [Microbacterium foliorum]CAH0127844.1 Trehalose-6-phosphate phosphatase [Microbacterium foliorum]
MTRTWTPGTADEAITAIAATPRLVVALDFDGTASPLVPDPMAARALPEVATQVARLAAMPDTVVAYVSGRSMHDLREITEHTDDSPIALAGSHGAQYWFPGTGEADATGPDTAEGDREELWAAARPIIDRHEGAEFEPKTFGMGVHTRTATAEVEKEVFAEIDALVAGRFPHWRRRAGHRVLEFSSRSEGKDAAMTALREQFDATGILFAGDDVTDEDAMRVLTDGDLGVRVGPGDSAAVLRVGNPQEMARLLEALADERASRRE